MQCGVCGSQDTKFVSGISKSGKNAGKPWQAYECQEPNCKNESGFKSRTFIPVAKPKQQSFQKAQTTDLSEVNRKLDLIMKHLGITFTTKPEPVSHASDEDVPF